MPWIGGVFVREEGIYSGATVWQQEEGAAIDIEADRHDNHDQDIADGITETLNRNGENEMLADLPMGGNKATGVGNGIAATDAINKGQADGEYIQTDGNSTVTADIPMSGNTLTGLKDGAAADDAATFGQTSVLGLEWAYVSASGGGAPSIVAQSGGISVSNVSTSKTRVTFGTAATSKNDQGFSAMPSIHARVYVPDAADSGNERTTTSVVVGQDDWDGGGTSQGPFYIFRTRA